MTLQDIGQLIGAVGGLAGIGVVVDGIRRCKRLSIDQGTAVTNTAVALVERLERRVNTLEAQLSDANRQVETLTKALREANNRADELQQRHDEMAESLVDAHAEVRHLRLVSKSLADELDRLANPPGNTTR